MPKKHCYIHKENFKNTNLLSMQVKSMFFLHAIAPYPSFNHIFVMTPIIFLSRFSSCFVYLKSKSHFIRRSKYHWSLIINQFRDLFLIVWSFVLNPKLIQLFFIEKSNSFERKKESPIQPRRHWCAKQLQWDYKCL